MKTKLAYFSKFIVLPMFIGFLCYQWSNALNMSVQIQDLTEYIQWMILSTDWTPNGNIKISMEWKWWSNWQWYIYASWDLQMDRWDWDISFLLSSATKSIWINNNNPTVTLDINNRTRATENAIVWRKMWIGTELVDSNNSRLKIYDDTNHNAEIDLHTNKNWFWHRAMYQAGWVNENQFRIRWNNADRVTITKDWSMGVWLNNPSHRLHIIWWIWSSSDVRIDRNFEMNWSINIWSNTYIWWTKTVQWNILWANLFLNWTLQASNVKWTCLGQCF